MPKRTTPKPPRDMPLMAALKLIESKGLRTVEQIMVDIDWRTLRALDVEGYLNVRFLNGTGGEFSPVRKPGPLFTPGQTGDPWRDKLAMKQSKRYYVLVSPEGMKKLSERGLGDAQLSDAPPPSAEQVEAAAEMKT